MTEPNEKSANDGRFHFKLVELSQLVDEVVKVLDIISLKNFIRDTIEKFCDSETVKDLEFVFRAMGSKENIYASTRIYSSQNVDSINRHGKDVRPYLCIEDVLQFIRTLLSNSSKLYRKLFLLYVLQRVPESIHSSIWDFLTCLLSRSIF